jgi:hypothetical protein
LKVLTIILVLRETKYSSVLVDRRADAPEQQWSVRRM